MPTDRALASSRWVATGAAALTTPAAIRAAEARVLRHVSNALETFDTDIGTVENGVTGLRADVTGLKTDLKAHDERDTNRFLQLHQGMADLEHRLEFLLNMLTLTRDDMHDGFARLGAKIQKKDPNEVTPPRRGRNGR